MGCVLSPVRTSATLSNVRCGFKGMWLGSLLVPDVGASQVSSPFHMSQIELTITWLALHLALSPCWQYIIPAHLLRDAFWLFYFSLHLRRWSTRWGHASFWPDATSCVCLSVDGDLTWLQADLSKLSPHGVVWLLGMDGWVNPYARGAHACSLWLLIVNAQACLVFLPNIEFSSVTRGSCCYAFRELKTLVQ